MTQPSKGKTAPLVENPDPLDDALAKAFGPGSPINLDFGDADRCSDKGSADKSSIHLRDPLEFFKEDGPPASDAKSWPYQAGRCKLLGRIAQGGMGEVFRGRDGDLGRELAVKVLSAHHAGKPALLRRFLEEAQIAGQLQHPGIVPIHEVGRLADGRPFFSMKLVKGRTLANLLAVRPHPSSDLSHFLAIFEQVCQTLAYSHSQHVIHRDLKPANIMVGAFGEVQVMDWGLAKVLAPAAGSEESPVQDESLVDSLAAHSSGSQTGLVLGTLAYMAPEQARAEKGLDERCDVFGLGAILCEILTGQPPYQGSGRKEMLKRSAAGDIASALSRLTNCQADKELVQLARDCLAPDRANRPRDAGQVSQAMTDYLNSVREKLRDAEVAKATALGKASSERKARNLAIGLMAALVVLMLLVGGTGTWYFSEQAKTTRLVDEALAEATQLWGQAREAPVGELDKWQAAQASVRQAEALMAERGGNSELLQRVEDLAIKLEFERNQAVLKAEDARKDRALVERLADIRIKATETKNGGFDIAGADTAYAQLFRENGLDIDSANVSLAGQSLKERSVAVDIAASLDDWAAARRWLKPTDKNGWQSISAIAKIVDPDPYRKALREAIEKEDGQSLEKLAEHADIPGLPAPTLELLGRSLFLAGRSEASIRFLEQAQRFYPNDFWINHHLGDYYGKIKPPRFDQQVRYYSVAAALRNQSPGVHNNLGIALMDQGSLAEAAIEFHKSLALQRNQAKVYSNLGSVLAQQGQTNEAIKALNKAIQIQSDFFNAHFNLANVLASDNKLDQAVDEYKKAIAIEPKGVQAQSNMGSALARLGKKDEAIATFREAINTDPTYPQAYCNLGSALCEKGAFDEAIPAFLDAIRLKPDYVFAYHNLGTAYWRKGQLNDAISAFRTAIRFKPDHYLSHTYLGKVFMQQDLLDEGLESFRDALRYSPKNPTIWLLIGYCLQRKGLDDQAIPNIRKALEIDPPYPEAHFRLAESLRKKGQYGEALKELSEARKQGILKKEPSLPSDELVKDYKRLAELDQKLPGVLDGSGKSLTPEDKRVLADFCLHEKRAYAAAAQLFEQLLQAQPEPKNEDAAIRTDAARSAILAAAGKSDDAANLADADRQHWRAQAIAWLHADLESWKKSLGKNKERETIRARLENWQKLPELTSMRERVFLEKLSDSDRHSCFALWKEVDEILAGMWEKE